MVYKTHLLVDIENAVNEEFSKSVGLSIEEIKKKVTEEIFSTLKVSCFMDANKLEQIVSYKLKDGSCKVLSLDWIYDCINTNVYNYKEIVNEENI